MKRYQVGSAFGTSRSTSIKRRLIKYSQRPGPYHAVQGGVLNPHRYPSYVIGKPDLIPDDVLASRSDTMDGGGGRGVLKPLSVSAGSTQVLAPSATTALLSGTATSPNPGDQIISYQWSMVSGPNLPTSTSPKLASTTVNNLIPGVYTFELYAASKYGETGFGLVQVTAS